MRYRCKIEIIAEILENANDRTGVHKTHLMYRTSANPPMLKKYLKILIENRLIEYQKNENTYRTTDRGIYFLKIYDELKELVSKKEISRDTETTC
ncbi:MAG TPA: winged helix-turn-helix domain-containing protein [Nitrososphaeraceae archaeon]|nr:winged helix-turn-helix domain-containing protein [Nitrososphaeraceae archaeon]